MPGLIFPYSFVNNTTADGEQVQEQFDAIKDFLDDLGIDSTGIPTGALADGSVTAGKLASNAVTTAKIADDAVTTAKIPRPGVFQDFASSPTGELTPNTWSDIGCSFSLTAGFYIVFATCVVTEAGGGNDTGIRLQSRLRFAGIGIDSVDNSLVIDSGSHQRTHRHVCPLTATATGTLDMQVQTNSLFTTVNNSSALLAYKVAD